MSKNTKTVLILLASAIFIAVVPLFVLKGAKFGELPGEVESLIFCVQTGIGVGVIAFFMGRFVERKKWMKEEPDNTPENTAGGKLLPHSEETAAGSACGESSGAAV